RGGGYVSLQGFFGVTSVFLPLLAAGMFSTGVGRLEVMGFLPATPTAWDTTFLLDDHGLVGGFLNGLIGYRSRPTMLEAGSYLLYLPVAGPLLFRSHAPSPRSSPPNPPIPPPPPCPAPPRLP